MARGGSRNHSGPPPEEGSRTSERKGYTLTALPPAGYDGVAPEFPLLGATGRELDVWAWAWTTPMACAWSVEPHRWRSVAMWVRWSVRAEDPEASAALVNAVVRYADDIGMTEAGRKFLGWKIANEAATEPAALDPAEDEDDPRNRLTVVRDGTGG